MSAPRKTHIKPFLALIVMAGLLLAACAQPQAMREPTEPRATPTPEPTILLPSPSPTEELITPSVSVIDQEIEMRTVTVSEVVSEGQGWMVIHADANGAPGPVIGHTAVSDEVNQDVVVEIDMENATETLYAMLHTDSGEEGVYEFPDADAPVQVEGEVVVERFMVSGLSVTPSVTVEDQSVEDGTVTILEVLSDGPGWIVVHMEEEGQPGPVIGHAEVEDGVNENVDVKIDATEATQTLFAMLHLDNGEVGTYEFPDGDPPVRLDDQIVVEPFTLTGGLPPSVIVMNQTIEDDAVTVKQVFSQTLGWIVIHADQDNAPGPVIGHAAISSGFNHDVKVEIDTANATDTLWAMLHEDSGDQEVYEFPGGDPPIVVDDEIVVDPFEVSGLEPGVAEQVMVAQVDSRFNPNEITVSVGTTIVWENQSNLPHTVTADDGSFDSGTMDPGDTFEVTYTEAGEVAYYCRFHGGPGGQGMSGTIIVTDQ